MAANQMAESEEAPGLKPFVLKWAENAPEELLGSRRSVFSDAVKGLDLAAAANEPDRPETTSPNDTLDCTNTNV